MLKTKGTTLISSSFVMLFALFLGSVSINAYAEKSYVSDSFFVSIRSGAGNEFRIINSRIRSGTPLTVLENPAGDWTKVQLPNNTQGWMRKQYIINKPTAKLQLDAALKNSPF